MRARGGTRTAFQTLQTLGSPGNMPNPGQSGRCTTQSETQSVDIVHTPISPLQSFQTNDRTPQRRGAVFFALTRIAVAEVFKYSPTFCKRTTPEGIDGLAWGMRRTWIQGRVFTAIQPPFGPSMA
jgi:hypothetical protein